MDSNARIRWSACPKQRRNDRQRKAPASLQRKTGVLVVEAQEMVRGLLHTALEQQGFQTFLTASGEEALEYCRKQTHAIDILLLDTALPGVDFIRTLQALRLVHPNLRCCLMTTTPAVVHGAGLAESGALCLMAKPFRLAELLHTLRMLAGSRESARAEPVLPFQVYQASPPGQERRRAVRYFCNLAAHCWLLGDATGFCRSATVLNISGGGVGFVSGQRFEPGKVLVIEMSNASGTLARTILAQVIHVQPSQGGTGWNHGCAFCDPLSEDALKSLLG